MKRENTSSKKTTYRGVLIVFSIVCLTISVFCFEYYRQLQSTIKEESGGYLKEVSSRIGSNVNRIIDGNYAVLETMSVYLKNAKVDSFSDVEPVVKEQQDYWNYENIMLINEKGKAYTVEGKEVTLTGDVYLQDAVLNKTNSLSMYQMVDGKECIVFAIPLDDMVVGDMKMVALASSYDASVFDKTLAMTSFSEQAYSHIIRKDGTIVVRSNSSESIQMGYNILSTISNYSIDSDTSFSKLQKDIAENKQGQIGFTTTNKQRYYMVYTPVHPEDWYLLTFVPVSVVNAKSDLLLRITLLMIAAIILVFAMLLILLGYSFYSNKKRLEKMAYVDSITEGNTIQKFYELSEMYLSNKKQSYAIIYTNIVKFKIMNDQFGREVCNTILKELYHFINSSLNKDECIARISADNFAILVEYNDEKFMINRFLEWYTNAENYTSMNHQQWSLPVVEFGIYIIDDDTITINQMLDRAKLSLKDYSQMINNKMHYSIYNESARNKILREKYLEDRMESALLNNDFKVYLQPKYNLNKNVIGGAEALTRWIDKEEGMIFPDEFIPLFEKNGFIIQLDLWVFEEVCKYQRKWLDEGKELVKISVNCSKVHLRNPDFLDSYCSIYEKYNLPREVIEIELTESVVMDDEKITSVVDKIHAAGFGCSMDDFGSGYSSLNLVQTIPVDTLKIDKIFFKEEGRDVSRTEAVVGSIINMAKSLQMETVAEGVEK
ncbi:MAG: GGDEF domain-containing protein, partial [Coprobacillus sp.]